MFCTTQKYQRESWEKQRYMYFSCDGKENNYFDPFHEQLVLCVQRGGGACTHWAWFKRLRPAPIQASLTEGPWGFGNEEKRGAAVNGEQQGLSVQGPDALGLVVDHGKCIFSGIFQFIVWSAIVLVFFLIVMFVSLGLKMK